MEFKLVAPVLIGIFLVSVGFVIFYPNVREYLRYKSQRNLWNAQMLEDHEWLVQSVIDISGGARLVLIKNNGSNANRKL